MIAPVLLVVASAFAAPPAPPADPAEAFRRAEVLLAADKFGDAAALFQVATEAGDPFLKRQAFDKLLGLYVRSGRQDKAIRTADKFRLFLAAVGDTATPPELDVIVGECYLGLGYYAEADTHFVSALAARPPLGFDRRLQAVRGRAEVAADRRDPAAAARWADLETAAREAAADADRRTDTELKVRAARHLAESLHRRGETAAALAVLAPLPAYHDTLKDPLGRRDAQLMRANLFAATKDFAAADPLFKEALDLHRTHAANNPMTAGDILAEWSAAAAGKRADAEAHRLAAIGEYRKVLDAAQANGADDTGGPLAAFVKIQSLTRTARQFKEALSLSREAGERWSEDPLLGGRLKSEQGGLELLTTSYTKARDLLAAALADLERADPPDMRVLPQVLVNFAAAELACGTPDAADKLLARCDDLYPAHGLPDDAVRAECLYLRGLAAGQKSDFAGAVRRFRAGLAVCDAVGPPAEAVRFNLWLNTALIHKEQGDVPAAIDALKQASESLARLPDPDDLSAALIVAVRADLHVSRLEVAAALKLVPEIEDVCTRRDVRGGYLWTTAQHVRALDRLGKRDFKEATRLWTDLSVVQEREKQLTLARTLNYLGVVAEFEAKVKPGRLKDAAAFYDRARLFEKAHPRCPASTQAITLWRLAALAHAAGNKADAYARLDEVFDLIDTARLNTFGEAAQRAQFFAQFAGAFETRAEWAANDGPAGDGDALLRVISRSRSRTLLDRILAAGVDPRAALMNTPNEKLVRDEDAARTEISRLRAEAQRLSTERPDDPKVVALVKELDAAQTRYAAAWKEIVNADPVTRVLTDPAFADKALDRLRADAAKADAVVLAYMVGRKESYAVLSATPTAPPEIFKLTVPAAFATEVGDAASAGGAGRNGLRGISLKRAPAQPDRPAAGFGGATVALTDAVAGRLVDQYLTQIADPDFTPTRGISLVRKGPAKEVLPAPGEALGDAFLPPDLRKRIREAGAKRLVLVPDGALHKLPLESLLVSTANGPRYALDELPAVCYAPSPVVLSVIMARDRKLAGPPSLLTVGDPVYPEGGQGAKSLADAAARGQPVMGLAGTLPRLPGTSDESHAIQVAFPPPARVVGLVRDQATEKNVVAELTRKRPNGESDVPRYVHLAAHGFADDAFGNLFAAVALTPPPPGTETPDNDGYLSLHEIYRLRLTGCELTVLSACVTNVGPQRPMEAGVTLAGAFLCAGSRGVLASCWSVHDQATASLMGSFFAAINPTNPGGPGSPADALKSARQKVRSTRGYEAPFYWAPFVYVGPPN